MSGRERAAVTRSTRLRAALKERGWAYSSLIARMRRAAARRGRALPKTESLVTMISRWVNGRERPDPFYQELLCEALEKSPVELGFVENALPAFTHATSGLEPWELADALTFTAIGEEVFDQLERTVVGYVQAYPAAPPGMLLTPVTEHLRVLVGKLRQPQPVAQRRRLVGAVGHLAALAGSLAFDLGQHSRAIGYFEAARTAGREAEDNDLLTWILALQSLVPTYTGRAEDALQTLECAVRLAGDRVSPGRRAWVTGLQARACAAVGDERACALALHRADQAIEKAGMASRAATDFFDPL